MSSTVFGYVRVSTERQDTGSDAQRHALNAAGCAVVIEEQASGRKARPMLAELVDRLEPGDVLTVVRFARISRSVADFYAIGERIRAVQDVFGKVFNEGTAFARDGSQFDHLFMDGDTFDQISVTPAVVGDAAKFMLENQDAIVARHEGNVLFIELPASVVLEIQYTEPGLQGDRSTGGTKPATLETGAEIGVPLFLNTGDKVKVDTRDGSYLGRVN